MVRSTDIAYLSAVSAAASDAPPLRLPPGGHLAEVPGGRGSSGGDDGIRVSAERPPGRSVSFNSFGSLARRCRERTAIIAAVIAASPFVSGNGKERAVEHGPRARLQLSPTGGFMLPPPDPTLGPIRAPRARARDASKGVSWCEAEGRYILRAGVVTPAAPPVSTTACGAPSLGEEPPNRVGACCQ